MSIFDSVISTNEWFIIGILFLGLANYLFKKIKERKLCQKCGNRTKSYKICYRCDYLECNDCSKKISTKLIKCDKCEEMICSKHIQDHNCEEDDETMEDENVEESTDEESEENEDFCCYSSDKKYCMIDYENCEDRQQFMDKISEIEAQGYSFVMKKNEYQFIFKKGEVMKNEGV